MTQMLATSTRMELQSIFFDITYTNMFTTNGGFYIVPVQDYCRHNVSGNKTGGMSLLGIVLVIEVYACILVA